MDGESSFDKQYREFMKNIDRSDVSKDATTLKDLFIAVGKDERVNQEVNRLLSGTQGLTVVVEGSSAIKENVDTLNDLVAIRKNQNDQIIVFDISPVAVRDHKEYVSAKYSDQNFRVIQGDMLDLCLQDASVDMVINDFTTNYCSSTQENEKVLAEIKRVLRGREALCLLSVAVDRRYDEQKYGTDQEKVPETLLDKPGGFNVLPVPNFERRKAWSVPYYEQLFNRVDFSFIKFDTEEGRTRFPASSEISFRRYLLQRK